MLLSFNLYKPLASGRKAVMAVLLSVLLLHHDSTNLKFVEPVCISTVKHCPGPTQPGQP